METTFLINNIILLLSYSPVFCKHISKKMSDENAPCPECEKQVNSDCRCKYCDCNIHCICSILKSEGHGAIYLCSTCADMFSEPAILLPSDGGPTVAASVVTACATAKQVGSTTIVASVITVGATAKQKERKENAR